MAKIKNTDNTKCRKNMDLSYISDMKVNGSPTLENRLAVSGR